MIWGIRKGWLRKAAGAGAGPGSPCRRALVTVGQRWCQPNWKPGGQDDRLHACEGTMRAAGVPVTTGTTAGQRWSPAAAHPARPPPPAVGQRHHPSLGFPWSCWLRRGTAPARARVARLPRSYRKAIAPSSSSSPATPASSSTGSTSTPTATSRHPPPSCTAIRSDAEDARRARQRTLKPRSPRTVTLAKTQEMCGPWLGVPPGCHTPSGVSP